MVSIIVLQQHDRVKLLHNVTGKDISDKTWTKVYPIDDKLGLSHKPKVQVFSESTLCEGGSVMSNASVKWESKFIRSEGIRAQRLGIPDQNICGKRSRML